LDSGGVNIDFRRLTVPEGASTSYLKDLSRKGGFKARRMDVGALVVLGLGFAFFVVGIIWVFRSAGSVGNKFGIAYSIGAIVDAVPLILMAVSAPVSNGIIQLVSPTSIPVYLFIFIAELAVFAVILWRWLGLLRVVHSMRSSAEYLQTNVNESIQKLQNVSDGLTDYTQSISDVNDNITNRYLDLEEIRKTPG